VTAAPPTRRLLPTELVERIWAHDQSLWTGGDEAQWLGWLDEPLRMQERLDDLLVFGSAVDVDDVVLLGMGGSSLAPEVMRRTFAADRFHVLDTTHPAAVRRLAEQLEPGRTMVIAASKSGTTLETRAQLSWFREWGRGTPAEFVAITDPGSELDRAAREDTFRAVFAGEPTVGGRYSALTVFGIVPALLMGLDVNRLLVRAEEMRQACRLAEGNPGLELGLALGEAWHEGRDKVSIGSDGGGFGLWVEQLLAESTGKQGRGLVPVVDGPADGPDVQAHEVRLENGYELGQEFFRWEFATAVAGALLGINPFDQPDVQAAKDRTAALLEAGGEPELEPAGSLDELLSGARPGEDYVAILAFVDPEREHDLEPLVARAEETGCAVTTGLGPRYLHSTGQLHKGGPDRGVFVQVVDDLGGEELAIPGRDFGFRRLIAAQAAGDYEALEERGRRVARVRLEEVA
jgi:transaldolase / glucose-6-phosphate isomerase